MTPELQIEIVGPDQSRIAFEECILFPGVTAASLTLRQRQSGWISFYLAVLPEAILDSSGAELETFPDRSAALIDAAECLVSALSAQKDRGSKKHRKQAEAVQDWALEQARLAHASAVPVEACDTGTLGGQLLDAMVDAIRDELDKTPVDFCPKCGQTQVTLQGGTRQGLLACVYCDKAEIDAHMNEGAQSDALDAPAPQSPRMAEYADRVAQKEPEIREALSAAPVPASAVRLIAIGELHESPWNPRQVYPEAALSELTESMKASGFRPWLPIVARPRLQAELLAGCEVAAGHRRLRAAKAAGLTEVPVLVREMSDAEFLDVLNFDNSGREDVHPLHEAAGWRAWMEKTGGTVLDIAARIGQSKEYVYDRLKYAALIEPVRVAFLERRIEARQALIIARLPESAQQTALEEGCFRREWVGGKSTTRPTSSRELSQWVADQKSGAHLADDKFDRDDAELLPAAGPCAACPKRVEDLCLDRACFDAKVEAKIQRMARSGFVAISTAYDQKDVPAGMVSQNEFEELQEQEPPDPDDESDEGLEEEKPCGFAEAAIVAHGPDRGKVKRICRNPQCPVHGDFLRRQSGPARTPEGKKDFWAEQAKGLPAKIERASRRAVLRAVLAKPLPWSMPHEHLQLLALALLSNSVDPEFLHCLNLPIGVKKCDGTSAVAAELKRLIVSPKGSPASDYLARIAFGLSMHEIAKDYCWESASEMARLHKAATLLGVDEGRIEKEVADRINAEFKAKRDKAKGKTGPAAKMPPPAKPAPEVKPKPEAKKPPASADARKAPIGKLPTLADKGAKKAAGKKAPAAPVKKAAAKAPAKKAAAKGGKK